MIRYKKRLTIGPNDAGCVVWARFHNQVHRTLPVLVRGVPGHVFVAAGVVGVVGVVAWWSGLRLEPHSMSLGAVVGDTHSLMNEH